MAEPAGPRPPRDPRLRAWSIALVAVAGLFVAAAIVALVAPGVRLRAGPLRVSFGDASRLAVQAALATLVAAVIVPAPRWRTLATTLAVIAVLVTGAVHSTPRRVGDGAEYLGVALQFSGGRPPAMTPGEVAATEARLQATPGFDDASLAQPALVGRGGTQDVPHFWAYSLLVAPFLAVSDAVGWHPNHAFTAANVLLLALLAWSLARRGDAVAAALLAAGPLMWWVDKAHAEVLLAALITWAVCLVETHPVVALVCAGLAAAQNPATLPVLAGVSVWAWRARPAGDRWRTALGLTAGFALALVHPTYYLWRLGRWSPLADAVAPGVPGLRALVTPLVDPNLGLLANAFLLCVMAGIGVARVAPRHRRMVGAILVLLLVFVARTPNVNHGGTPGISRYGLWLIAVASPLVCAAARGLGRPSPLVPALVLAASVLATWTSYRPALIDRSGGGPSALAEVLWTRWPAVDAPLPEVFAERVARIDGLPPVPVAVEGCSKVLIRGDGADAWWPFPCAPAEAPPFCRVDGALCYVDGGRFSRTPSQPAFAWESVPEQAWTLRQQGTLPALAARLGDSPRAVPLGRGRRVEGAVGVNLTLVVEGAGGAAAWVRVRRDTAALRLRLDVEADVEILDTNSGAIVTATWLPPGRHTLPMPAAASLRVVVTDAR